MLTFAEKYETVQFGWWSWFVKSGVSVGLLSKLIHRVANEFFTENEIDSLIDFFDCYDPFADNVEILVTTLLILLGYAPWNQYYFDNMSKEKFRELTELVKKKYQAEKKKRKIEEDF